MHSALKMARQGSGQVSIPIPDKRSTSQAEIKENVSVELRHLLQFPHGAVDNCKHGATTFFQTP